MTHSYLVVLDTTLDNLPISTHENYAEATRAAAAFRLDDPQVKEALDILDVDIELSTPTDISILSFCNGRVTRRKVFRDLIAEGQLQPLVRRVS